MEVSIKTKIWIAGHIGFCRVQARVVVFQSQQADYIKTFGMEFSAAKCIASLSLKLYIVKEKKISPDKVGLTELADETRALCVT